MNRAKSTCRDYQLAPATIMDQDDTIFIITTETFRDIKRQSTVYYTIRSKYGIVKRRYTDFYSLRKCLCKMYPTKPVPPIPEKHSFKKLISKPLSYKNDPATINLRTRLLGSFLNNLTQELVFRESIMVIRFLDPDERNWAEALKTPPFTSLPQSIFLSSPRSPLQPNPYHSYFPIPPLSLVKNFDSPLNQEFRPSELFFRRILKYLTHLHKLNKHFENDLHRYNKQLVGLGGSLNIFSLIDTTISKSNGTTLDENNSIEGVGQSVDSSFINLERFILHFVANFKEPIMELRSFCMVIINLLQYRKLKELQLCYLKRIIVKKQTRTQRLLDIERLSQKLDIALQQGASQSPTIANAIRNLEAQPSVYQSVYFDPKSYADDEDSSAEGVNNLVASDIVDDEDNYSMSDNNSINLNSSALFHEYKDQRVWNMFSKVTKNIQAMTPLERSLEIQANCRDLQKLVHCFQLLNDDVTFVSIEIEKSTLRERQYVKDRFLELLENFKMILCIYSRSNQIAWENGI